MNAKVFIAVWALGYDYLMDVDMAEVFLLALFLGWLVKEVWPWAVSHLKMKHGIRQIA